MMIICNTIYIYLYIIVNKIYCNYGITQYCTQSSNNFIPNLNDWWYMRHICNVWYMVQLWIKFISHHVHSSRCSSSLPLHSQLSGQDIQGLVQVSGQQWRWTSKGSSRLHEEGRHFILKEPLVLKLDNFSVIIYRLRIDL